MLRRDTMTIDGATRFGSAHLLCHFVLCDGSVSAIDYEIDPLVYEALGNRRDGGIIER